jgi:hypothetical protein
VIQTSISVPNCEKQNCRTELKLGVSVHHVQEAVANIEKYLRKKNLSGLKSKVRGPWPSGYVAELDDSRELTVNPEEAFFISLRLES